MAVKKEKPPIMLVKDLLVKLNNVYKDIYLYKNKFCIGAKNTNEEALGDILCTLEPVYEEAVKKFIGVDEVIYIDIKPFKEWISSCITDGLCTSENVIHVINFMDYAKVVRKKSEIQSVIEKVDKLYERFHVDGIVWKNLSQYEDMINIIYTDNQIFNLPISRITEDAENTDYVTMTKQLLPVVSQKTIKDAYINISKLKVDEEHLYEMLIDFHFTHFSMNCLYHILPLKIE